PRQEPPACGVDSVHRLSRPPGRRGRSAGWCGVVRCTEPRVSRSGRLGGGPRQQRSLADRGSHCPSWGVVLDRDLNASKNIDVAHGCPRGLYLWTINQCPSLFGRRHATSLPPIPPNRFPQRLADLGYITHTLGGIEVMRPPLCDVPA